MMAAQRAEKTGYLQCPADEAEASIVSVGGILFT